MAGSNRSGHLAFSAEWEPQRDNTIKRGGEQVKKEDIGLLLLFFFLLLKCLFPPSASLREGVSAFLGMEERTVQTMLKIGG